MESQAFEIRFSTATQSTVTKIQRAIKTQKQ